MSSKCRVGIMGCANIAKKNVLAIHLSTNCEVVAIASRSREKAEAWAKDNVPNYTDAPSFTIHEGYDSLLKDENVDACYLPLPTTHHLEWVTKCAKAGVHVCCDWYLPRSDETAVCHGREARSV